LKFDFSLFMHTSPLSFFRTNNGFNQANTVPEYIMFILIKDTCTLRIVNHHENKIIITKM